MASTSQGIHDLTQAVRSCWPAGTVRVGIDVVEVQDIEESLAKFGDRFVRRLFTPHEARVANGSPERLAARFAVKEAVIKALDLSEAGIDWRDIELCSDEAGRPSLTLHGRARRIARSAGAGEMLVSLAHERGLAIAVVVAPLQPVARAQEQKTAKTART